MTDRRRSEDSRCPRCEGDGSYSRLADCTTFDRDCGCNGPRVLVDPCDVCGGSGDVTEAVRDCADAAFLHHCATGDDLDCTCGAHTFDRHAGHTVYTAEDFA